MPPEAKTGAEVFVVGQRCTVEGEHVEDGVAGVGAGPEGEHVLLAHPAAEGGGELAAKRELVEELVDAHHVGAALLLEGDLQGGEAATEGIAIAIEVASPQHRAQQILAAEAGVEVELQVVVERDLLTRGVVAHPTHHKGGQAGELGGGGELTGFQFPSLGLEAIDAALEDGEFLLELRHQALELVGYFSDAIKAGVEQGGGLKAGHDLPTSEGAVGVAGHAAVTLDQVAEGLVRPVAGAQIGELADAGDLLLAARVMVDALKVELGCCSRVRRQQAQDCRGSH